MVNTLRKFKVTGWMRAPDDVNSARTPMKSTCVEAPTELDAIKTYARCNGIPEKLWDSGHPRPPVVIRAETV